MIKFLDAPEDVKKEAWTDKDYYNRYGSLAPEVSPDLPRVMISGTYNLVHNPCTLTPKQLIKHATRLL